MGLTPHVSQAINLNDSEATTPTPAPSNGAALSRGGVRKIDSPASNAGSGPKRPYHAIADQHAHPANRRAKVDPEAPQAKVPGVKFDPRQVQPAVEDE